MTQTIRSRPPTRDVDETISTTQELPPPPPGRWARLWTWMRTSLAFRRALIIVPVVAVLMVGVISGQDGDSVVTFSGAAGSPTDDAALAQWRANARPVLDEIEATRASVAEVIASGEPEEVAAQCRAAWQLVPGWADALVPAPDAEVDATIRARLHALNEQFGSCALGP